MNTKPKESYRPFASSEQQKVARTPEAQKAQLVPRWALDEVAEANLKASQESYSESVAKAA